MSDAPLYGLVLAGGRSRRMGRDKAALTVDGRSALARTVALLDAVCARTFVSVGADGPDALRAAYPTIVDRNGGVGPADGIASALATHPDAAWLVLACDLPRLNAATLATLVEQRDATHDATAFRSVNDDLPEPLCAIYEPRSKPRIDEFLAADRRCARKMLINMNTCLLPPPPGDPLANMNTPADWDRFEQTLEAS